MTMTLAQLLEGAKSTLSLKPKGSVYDFTGYDVRLYKRLDGYQLYVSRKPDEKMDEIRFAISLSREEVKFLNRCMPKKEV